MKKALYLLPFLVVLFALSVVAQRFGQDAEGPWRTESRRHDTLVKFEGGIGVIPVASGVGQAATAEVVNRNIVRGVQPPGQIWVISALRAEEDDSGVVGVPITERSPGKRTS